MPDQQYGGFDKGIMKEKGLFHIICMVCTYVILTVLHEKSKHQ